MRCNDTLMGTEGDKLITDNIRDKAHNLFKPAARHKI